MLFKCAHCGKKKDKPAGEVNRAKASGLPLFCNRKCFGLSRRQYKPKAHKVAEKRAYDMEYRAENLTTIRAKKAAYFQRTYDPAKAAIERKKRMAFHVEYCRRPSYRLWKAEYDRRRRASFYGPFADAFQLTIDLNREIKRRSNNYEIRQANDTGNKAQKRDRSSSGTRRHADSPAHRVQS